MPRRLPLEAMVWTEGLAALAFSDSGGSAHFSLCPLKNLGLGFCPGCGLGTSVSLLFDGNFAASFNAHPLGFFAVVVLSFRIVNLTKQYLKNYGKSY